MKDKLITTYTHTAFDTHKMLCENGQSQFRLSGLRNLQLRGQNSNWTRFISNSFGLLEDRDVVSAQDDAVYVSWNRSHETLKRLKQSNKNNLWIA